MTVDVSCFHKCAVSFVVTRVISADVQHVEKLSCASEQLFTVCELYPLSNGCVTHAFFHIYSPAVGRSTAGARG